MKRRWKDAALLYTSVQNKIELDHMNNVRTMCDRVNYQTSNKNVYVSISNAMFYKTQKVEVFVMSHFRISTVMVSDTKHLYSNSLPAFPLPHDTCFIRENYNFHESSAIAFSVYHFRSAIVFVISLLIPSGNRTF